MNGINLSRVTNNPIGAIGGAVLSYYLLKKYSSVNNKLFIAAMVIAGGYIGANIQSTIKAKSGAPTKATIEE